MRRWRASIPVRQPFPWDWLLAYLSARLVSGAESIAAGEYRRAVAGGEVRVRYDAAASVLRVDGTPHLDRADALVRVARLFDAGHDPAPVARHLRRSPYLRPLLRALPGLRPLGAWSSFELCVRTVLGQQVTVAAANTLMARLLDRCGRIEPALVAAARLDAMGMPGARVRTLQHLARAVAGGTLDLDCGDWPRIEPGLRALPGFGPWTRTYLAIRLGRDADAFPETDVGLIRGARAASAAELLRMAEPWRPYRAHAAIYLWSAA